MLDYICCQCQCQCWIICSQCQWSETHGGESDLASSLAPRVASCPQAAVRQEPGMVWFGVLYSMAWCHMVWYGKVWHGMVWYGRKNLLLLAVNCKWSAATLRSSLFHIAWLFLVKDPVMIGISSIAVCCSSSDSFWVKGLSCSRFLF